MMMITMMIVMVLVMMMMRRRIVCLCAVCYMIYIYTLIDDRLYIAILRSLEQTHCARM